MGHNLNLAKLPASGTIRLRPTTDNDLEFVFRVERDNENAPFVLQWSHERHLSAIYSEDTAHLVVEARGGRRLLGYVILSGLTDPAHSIEFVRIVIAEKGKGYGRETVHLIKRLAFEDLAAHRLWLDVMEHNTRAQRLYESHGFVFEGTLRDATRVGNQFYSLHVLSMLEDEHRRAVRRPRQASAEADGRT